MPRFPMPRRIGSPAHTRSILHDHKVWYKAKRLAELQEQAREDDDA